MVFHQKSIIDNYRPISILPSLSKIFEKVVFHQLHTHFNNNNLLTDNQYGFCKKHSTEHFILHFVDRIISELDKSNTPLAIFIDLSKAFDCLNHDILIEKLQYYGIQDIALKWFKSYLMCRKQFEVLDNNKSNINTGVPQGSILGLLLFIIYTNDIVHVSKYFESMMIPH